jgi:hypothetical protein
VPANRWFMSLSVVSRFQMRMAKPSNEGGSLAEPR